MIIQYERSFDEYHTKKDRIYRVLTKMEKQSALSAVPFPLPNAIQHDFPQLEQVSGIALFPAVQVLVLDKEGHAQKKFKENTGTFFVEPSFFNIFDFSWLAGNPATALRDPASAVLTKETAEKYFGDWKQAIGQSLKLDNHLLVTVTGILANAPSNTDFQLRIVLPYSLTGFAQSTDWISIDDIHSCYMLLPDGMPAAAIDRQLAGFTSKYLPADNKTTYLLQPLHQVHYDPVAHNYLGRTITPERIRTLWLIAAFILLIACVNFINLSTAQAINRAKEVGVRKVLGSNSRQLRIQFLIEMLLLVIASVALATVIAALLLKPVGAVLTVSLSLHLLYQPTVMGFLTALVVIVTLLAGFYPSLVLSRFNPVKALKSKLSARINKGISLRRALVVCQFVIAQALIIGTLLIIKQMKYFEERPMGFNKEAIINVPFQADSAGRSKMDYIKNRLLAVKGISAVSFNSQSPTSSSNDNNWWTDFKFDHAPKGTPFAAIIKWADGSYINTYQLQLTAGRNVTTTDSVREFMVNETLVKKLGYTNAQDILNKEINLWDGFAKGPIVGVLKDFNSVSMKYAIAPVFIVNYKNRFSNVSIKLATPEIKAVIKSVEAIWSDAYPDYVFTYQFLDEAIAAYYQEERQLSTLYTLFAGIAIFLSCLGLYGLASFMAVQRIKEVGVRKVLGASVRNIVYLFSKEFVVLIAFAFAIATPLTWYMISEWLQNFEYRINISWWLFIAGGAGAVLLALLTVSFRAIKAAQADPVKNLRAE